MVDLFDGLSLGINLASKTHRHREFTFITLGHFLKLHGSEQEIAIGSGQGHACKACLMIQRSWAVFSETLKCWERHSRKHVLKGCSSVGLTAGEPV